MNHQDFIVRLDSNGYEKTFLSRVMQSPAGEGQGSFRIPFEVPNLKAGSLRDFVRTNQGLGPQEKGKLLFQALFSGQIRSRYDASRGRLRNLGDQGLRIKISLALDAPGGARLNALPWEYLYDAEGNTALALGRQVSIVRHVHLGFPGDDRPPLPSPLRILVVMAEPTGAQTLDLESEMKKIAKAWSTPGLAEMTFLRHATLESLRDELLARKINVLHFMGHGDLDRQTGEGVLILEDEYGRPDLVTASALADQLRDCTGLRLLFLNACKTAQAFASGPFSGVATALLQVGIPAVIAMQFPITDAAALAFSEGVYRRLALGDSIDEAVAEGRLAIRRRLPDSLEWGTPVLFLRAPDGRLFLPAKPSGRATPRWKTGTAAALVLAVGLSQAIDFSWPRKHEPRIEEKESPASRPEPPKPDGMQGDERNTTPAQDPPKPEPRTDTNTLDKKNKERSSIQRDDQDGKTVRATTPVDPPPVSPRRPASYSLEDGDTVEIGDGATASVRFLRYGNGIPFANVTVSPAGAASVNQAVMGSNETIEVPTGQGTLYVDVLSYNPDAGTLTLKPRTG
jgi:hypothetical protein